MSEISLNQNLLILGAGGHGRVVKETAETLGGFGEIAFLDDAPGHPLAMGTCKEYRQFSKKYQYAFPAVGNNLLRMEWMEELKEAGYLIPTFVHPTAYVSPSAKVEEGVFISARAAVNAQVTIERGCIFSLGALADHDAYIEYGAHIFAGMIVPPNCKVFAMTNVTSKL